MKGKGRAHPSSVTCYNSSGKPTGSLPMAGDMPGRAPIIIPRTTPIATMIGPNPLRTVCRPIIKFEAIKSIIDKSKVELEMLRDIFAELDSRGIEIEITSERNSPPFPNIKITAKSSDFVGCNAIYMQFTCGF